MNIVEFLEARIAEDEALASEAIKPENCHPYGDTSFPPIPPEQWGREMKGYVGGPWADHAGQHNPLRVLAECAAKREIIADRKLIDRSSNDGEWFMGYSDANYIAVGFLAAAYSDHPDYQQEWIIKSAT